MSSSRKDRLEAYLATTRSGSLGNAPQGRVARWQRYVAVTGSAVVLASHASLSNLAAAHAAADAHLFAHPRHFAMAGRNRRLFAAAAALDGAQTAQAKPPVISANGVVPLYGTVSMIQPGSWATIYGTNLAAGTAEWNGDFPTSLGGATVTVNGKLAYLYFVSPGQINFQAPNDSTAGPVPVVVTTAAGQATSTVTLSPYSPSFDLLDSLHVTAIILRPNGGGAFGNGAYDILGPDGNCFGYPTVSAKAGDLVEIFGVGFGPTNPVVHAGTPFSGVAPITNDATLYINGMIVAPAYVGLSGAGLYQMNVLIPPGLGQGDVPIQAWVGGFSTQSNVWLSLSGGAFRGTCVYTGDGGDGDGDGGDGGVGVGDGDGGGGDGGSVGDGGDGGGDGGDGGDGDGGDGGDGGGGGDGGDGGDGDGDGGA